MATIYGLFIILFFIGYFISIPLLIEAAKAKGYYKDGGTGGLWAIGLLASPIVLGLCVCALPDKRLRELVAANGSSTASPASGQDGLPSA